MTQRSLRRFRLASQVLFFALFVALLARTQFSGSLQAGGADVQRLPYPVSIFLEVNPLVALATALSSGTLYRRLAWCLVILVPTFALGRFFCGWVCPLGTLNHFFGSWKSEKKRGAKLIASNRYHSWQAIKYYVLGTALVLAVFGSVALLMLALREPRRLGVAAAGAEPGELEVDLGVFRRLLAQPDEHLRRAVVLPGCRQCRGQPQAVGPVVAIHRHGRMCLNRACGCRREEMLTMKSAG
jgi:hypothetical protein